MFVEHVDALSSAYIPQENLQPFHYAITASYLSPQTCIPLISSEVAHISQENHSEQYANAKLTNQSGDDPCKV